jgi:hypothetical protein
LDSEKLRFSVDQIVPLAAAAEAYAGRLTRRGHGKTVIRISGWSS